MPELLDRREIGLPSAGVKINEMIAKDVHTRRVCSRLYMYYAILVTTGSVKYMDCSR